jgi:hypothetical protein
MPQFEASAPRTGTNVISHARPRFAGSPQRHYPAGQAAPATTCASRIAAFLAANPQYLSSVAGDNGMTATGWVIFFRANPDCTTDPTVFVNNLPTNYTMPSPPAGQSCNDQISTFIANNPQFKSNLPQDNGMTSTGWAIFMKGASACATDPTVWTSSVQPLPPPTAQPLVVQTGGGSGSPPNGTGGGSPNQAPPPAPAPTTDNSGFWLLGAAAVGAYLLWPKTKTRSSRRSSRAAV